jgi:hypothetical protein
VTDQKLILNADKAQLYMLRVSLAFIEQNAMKRVSHSPYSNDLASSDFLLFGDIKKFSMVALSSQPTTFDQRF